MDVPATFVSYCRADEVFALRLIQDLKAAGANVWFDQLDIPPGMPWDLAIEDALSKCPLKPRLKPRHAVLIVLTWLSVSLLERLFLWHSGTARWFTLDLAPGNLKTALIWTLYGSTLGLILSAALGRTRPAGIATGAIAFAAAGVLRGWLLQIVYMQPLLSTG